MKTISLVLFLLAAFLLTHPALATNDRPPKGFSNHKFNDGHNPSTKDGITTFIIRDKQCSHIDYGDGRGENDCHNGNVREVFSYCCQAKMGQAVSYKFDVLIDPSFAYSGFYNDHSLGFIADGLDSRLRIASWEGQFLHIFSMS